MKRGIAHEGCDGLWWVNSISPQYKFMDAEFWLVRRNVFKRRARNVARALVGWVKSGVERGGTSVNHSNIEHHGSNDSRLGIFTFENNHISLFIECGDYYLDLIRRLRSYSTG